MPTTEVWNEDNLRKSIAGVWGEHGAHIDVYDEILRRARAYLPLAAENAQLRAEVNGTNWENSLLYNAPDHYDGDEAQTEIITRYVCDLEAVRDAAVTVVERLACRHLFDPDCPRCDWMLPLRTAMVQAMGWDEERGPHTGEGGDENGAQNDG